MRVVFAGIGVMVLFRIRLVAMGIRWLEVKFRPGSGYGEPIECDRSCKHQADVARRRFVEVNA